MTNDTMNDKALKIKTLDFEGHPVTAVLWRDRWCWPAAAVGEAIGYEQGRKLVAQIRGPWAAEFFEGKHYEMLKGAELREFLALSNDCTAGVQSRRGGAQAMMVLTEAGIDLALLKSETDKGRRLRVLLVDYILPQLRATGTATLPGAPVPGITVADLDGLRAELAALREEMTGRALPSTAVAGAFTPSQRAALLKGHINKAAKLYVKADRARSFKSWRMHVESKVRTASGYTQGARCSFENMPTATWERGMVAAMQEVATAERIAPLLTEDQADLPLKKPN